ncbi:hypothetical protein C5Y96_19965 [Blastopirellula marina]|uniref:Phospholipase C n=1 Tax=Blastopirellula marina TaxID=124 RepID=A0A2S8F3N3_9BACT|nr:MULTISPECIES: DUF4332 domain-containing protein [Pirellulaceae]PQO26761.1 hypothetical protein C5Y96_19965 [Blastopirellula marina]RCS46240.1 DUF4332 domain-containing protein [Bremerella cremea]
MHLLFDILYAAHANGTHHKLAMDALKHLPAENSERRRNIFLKHYEPYLRGSKDPDKKFKDFRNHVLHPSQDYWGGAEKAARKWYDLLVESIRAEKWKEAAYNAGVLSHYYSDPIMPFHTGSSEAENNIHRAAEWSISCSYDRLRSMVELRGLPAVRMPSGQNWLEQMVRDGATKSHANYQSLIDHYNFKQGRRNPPRGLDVTCRDIASEMIGYAIAGFAKIIGRAFDEAAHEPPYVLLVVETVFATLEMPVQWVTKRMENAEQAELVRQMFREYQKTGKVERNLPEDIRVVRDELEADMNPNKPQEGERPLYEVPDLPEVSLASLKLTGTRKSTTIKPEPPKPRREIEEEKTKPRVSIPIPSFEEDEEEDEPAPKPFAEKPQPSQLYQPTKGVTIRPKPQEPEDELEEEDEPASPVERTRPPVSVKPPQVEPPKVQAAKIEQPEEDYPPSVSIAPKARPQSEVKQPLAETPPRERAIEEKKPIEDKPLKFYLNWEDPVVDAPSIGNKTAKRLNGVGIKTVAQLVSADAKTVAPKLKAKHITPKLFAEWQAQAVLAYRIPMLRGHDAQLLTACGLETPEDVAKASAKDLLAEVTEFAETSDGQRIIRSGTPPDLAEVTNWIAWARQARRSQAA